MKPDPNWPESIIKEYEQKVAELNIWWEEHNIPTHGRQTALERNYCMFDKKAKDQTKVVSINGEPVQIPELDFKQELVKVYNSMGGTLAFVNWAEKNPSDFFTKLFPKLLDSETSNEVLIQILQQSGPPE